MGWAVYINKTQYFEPVPLELWDYQIGGYQVLAKWLTAGSGCSAWKRSKPIVAW